VPGELLVALAPGADATAIARRHGLEIRNPDIRPGLALLSTTAGTEAPALQALLGDADVVGVARNAVIIGAGKKPKSRNKTDTTTTDTDTADTTSTDTATADTTSTDTAAADTTSTDTDTAETSTGTDAAAETDTSSGDSASSDSDSEYDWSSWTDSWSSGDTNQDGASDWYSAAIETAAAEYGSSGETDWTGTTTDTSDLEDLANAFLSMLSSASDSSESAPAGHQWHHTVAQAPATPAAGLGDVTVAVLDSGVAYTDHTAEDGTVFVAASSLSSSPIVAPWDFVDNDAQPLDEHQHGTHIASTIASNGEVLGVAPGVGIMPLRVLDANNAGTEAHLIAAIDHAVANGADVINMSISFAPGYHPSPMLQQALEDAHRAGVVLIAAAGNDGVDTVSWPAASPVVLSVAASAPLADYAMASDALVYENIADLADYSNRSLAVDLVAPGGSMDVDNTADGYPDGILAETIALNDPDNMGLWFYAGSSQAAAVASGAAAQLIASGASADATINALMAGTRNLNLQDVYDGVGRGYLNASKSISHQEDEHHSLQAARDISVALMPYLETRADGMVRPAARVTVIGDEGAVDLGMWVHAAIEGSNGTEHLGCWSDATTGECTLTGAWMAPTDEAGQELPLGWSVKVESVRYPLEQVLVHPRNVFFATDALAVLIAAAEQTGQLPANFGLAVHWPAGADPEVGELAESTVVLNAGTGLSSSPLGVIMTPAMLNPSGPLSMEGSGLSSSPLGVAQFDLSLMNLDGTGLSSSPLGIAPLFLASLTVDLDGTGLSSSPLGFGLFGDEPLSSWGSGLSSSPLGLAELSVSTMVDTSGQVSNLLILDGSGLSSSPLGFHADALFAPGGGGVDLGGLELQDGAAIHGTSTAPGLLAGTSLGDIVQAGGFRNALGAEPTLNFNASSIGVAVGLQGTTEAASSGASTGTAGVALSTER
jgi:hypothetical protein